MKRPIGLLIFGILVLLMNGLNAEASAKSQKQLGLGIILGEPTGISLEWQFNRRNHLQGALAWDLGGATDEFVLQAEYIWNMIDLIRIEKVLIDLYVGAGGKILFSTVDTGVGVRIPVGLAHTLSNPKIELFLELVPILLLAPATDFEFDGAVGARIYF